MTAGWVAGDARARSLVRRRLGPRRGRAVAAAGSLEAALTTLQATPYGHAVHPGQTLAEAQHGVAATLLWHLRVLAGWLPRDGAGLVRLLAGGFEIANTDELVHALTGGRPDPPFRLGALETAWSRLREADTPAAVRATLAASPWGDPGGQTPYAVGVGMRASWASRIAARLAPATPWAAGAVAVLVAGERFAAGRPLPAPAARQAAGLLGADALDATSLPEMARRLPPDARWALSGVTGPDALWRAEPAWWSRVEDDGFRLLRTRRFTAEPVVGAVALLAADAWRIRAALEAAVRGARALEVFDAVA